MYRDSGVTTRLDRNERGSGEDISTHYRYDRRHSHHRYDARPDCHADHCELCCKTKANSQTANLPVAYVSAWCSCNANELADHMTTQDVADLQSGTRSQAAILTAKAEAAVIACTQKVKLEVTGDTVK